LEQVGFPCAGGAVKQERVVSVAGKIRHYQDNGNEVTGGRGTSSRLPVAVAIR
jgi:hypothetical protein